MRKKTSSRMGARDRQPESPFPLPVSIVASILNNLAGICEDQGDYAEAARLGQRAVAIMAPFTRRHNEIVLLAPRHRYRIESS
jgi:hypothetical protein